MHNTIYDLQIIREHLFYVLKFEYCSLCRVDTSFFFGNLTPRRQFNICVLTPKERSSLRSLPQNTGYGPGARSTSSERPLRPAVTGFILHTRDLAVGTRDDWTFRLRRDIRLYRCWEDGRLDHGNL
ncbi:hypothetical protein ACEPAH_1774 [Sanghuangporus vaninii]